VLQKHKKAMKLVSGARTKKHQKKVAQRARLAAKAEEVHLPEDEIMVEAPKVRKVAKKKKQKGASAAPSVMQE
jgi:hypothetical protein